MVEQVVRAVRSFQEGDQLDKAWYRSLTPQERIAIFLELNRRWPTQHDADSAEGLPRVYRMIKFS